MLVLERTAAQPNPNLRRPNNGFLCLMDLDTNPGRAVAATYARRLRAPRARVDREGFKAALNVGGHA